MPTDLESTPPLVSEHDTWISVDPVAGCPAACDYCYLGALNLRTTKPQQRASVRVALEQVRRHVRGRTDRTPVAIGNYTDMAMTPANRRYLVDFARGFHEVCPERPLVVITKSPRIVDVLHDLDELGHDVLVFLSHSYSSVSAQPLESGPVGSDQDLYATIRAISQTRHLTAVHYWRPFLRASNPPEQLAHRVAELSAAGALASVVVGFKSSSPRSQWWSPMTRRALSSADESQPGNELFDHAGWTQLVQLARAANYPVYRNTSCAIAAALQEADALRSFEGVEVTAKCRQTSCPVNQRGICGVARTVEIGADRVAAALACLPPKASSDGWVLDGGHLTVRGQLSETEANTATHVSGLRVRPTSVRAEKAWVNFDAPDVRVPVTS